MVCICIIEKILIMTKYLFYSLKPWTTGPRKQIYKYICERKISLYKKYFFENLENII